MQNWKIISNFVCCIKIIFIIKMNYRLYELSHSDFEKLIITICQKILGMDIDCFSEGKDRGIDGKFKGKANCFPSETEQWEGKFIIQSKHTNTPDSSCADSDFKTIVNKEIDKIKKLKINNEIDYYLLFTNRKYTATSGENLLNKIIEETQVNNVRIFGLEKINSYLDSFPEIVKQYKLRESKIPLNFSQDDFKEILIEFAKIKDKIITSIKKQAEDNRYNLDRIDLEIKNEINNLSKDYFQNEIKAKSLSDFQLITDFLQNPINDEFKEMYLDISNELSNLITVYQEKVDKFEEFFLVIYDGLISNDNDNDKSLKGKKRNIYIFLHYMYCSCDIGIKEKYD